MLNIIIPNSFADDEDDEEYIQDEINELVVESATKATDEPILNARAAIIYDRTTKEIIWGKNEKAKNCQVLMSLA